MLAALFVVLVLASCWFYPRLLAIIVHNADWEQLAQLGDMYGAPNALFSGLAFAGVIFAIHLQREDLDLQRKELELTRIELAQTADSQLALARFQNEMYHRRQLSSLASAARAAAALSSTGGFIRPVEGRMSNSTSAAIANFATFWTEYAGDIGAAVGPRDPVFVALSDLFLPAANARGERVRQLESWWTKHGPPPDMFANLADRLVVVMNEEAERAETYRVRLQKGHAKS